MNWKIAIQVSERNIKNILFQTKAVLLEFLKYVIGSNYKLTRSGEFLIFKQIFYIICVEKLKKNWELYAVF